MLDCPDPVKLGKFYQRVAGGELAVVTETFVELRFDTFSLGFQRDLNYRAPTWPDPRVPQQCHLDFMAEDLDAEQARVIAAGGTATAVQPEPKNFRVFLDPAGHPFCLTRWRTLSGPAQSR
jgi:predicted enzyme related to lactoylglutathione lyase